VSALVDPTYKVDARPLKYIEPASAIAALVQRPLAYIDGLALADAYMKDWRRSLRPTPSEDQKRDAP